MVSVTISKKKQISIYFYLSRILLKSLTFNMWVFIAYVDFSWSTTRSLSLIWVIPMTTRMVSLIFRPTGNRVPTRLSYPTRPSQNVLGCPSPPSVLGIFQVQPFWTNPWGTGKSGSSSQTSKHLSTSHNLQWKNLPKKTTEKCHVLASQEKKRLTKRMEFPHTRTFADDIRGGKRGICGFKSRLPHPNRHGHVF